MKPDQTNSTPDVHDEQDINAMPDAVEPSTSSHATPEFSAEPEEPVSPATPAATAASAAPAQPVQPAQSAFGTNPQPFAPQPQKSKKGLIIGIVVASVAAVGLIGGGVGAYVWYQNPDKVLDDAMANALLEKRGTYDTKLEITNTGSSAGSLVMNYQTTSDGEKMAISYDVDANIADTKAKLDGGMYYEVGGSYYMKVNGINKILNDYMDAQGVSRSQMPSSILDIIDKVDNKWISVSEADLKDIIKDDDTLVKLKQCTDKVATNLQKDLSYKQEIATLYQKNRFILIDKSLGSRDGAVGFELKGDESKAKEFVKGLKDTKVVKEYRDCLPSDQHSSFDEIFNDTSSKSTSSSADDGKIEVWIDQWSHKLRSAKVTSDSSGSKAIVEITAKPFDASKLVKPNQDTTASELKKDIEDIQTEIYGNYGPSASSSFDSQSFGSLSF